MHLCFGGASLFRAVTRRRQGPKTKEERTLVLCVLARGHRGVALPLAACAAAQQQLVRQILLTDL